VRREIETAADVDALARAVAGLPRVAIRLLDAHVHAPDVLAVLATATDALTRRLTELTLAELGDPPAPWAWLSLGSEARSEQTLSTDQDNGLAFEGDGPELDAYFSAFAGRMNAGLARCGYAECRANVMARNPAWRLSRRRWLELFETLLSAPTYDLIRVAMIGLDLRAVAGPLSVQRDLDTLLESAPDHPYFLERLARAAQEFRPPLGFLRGFVVERTGEHVGMLDVKAGGMVPLVDVARLHALSVGSAAKPTLDRLRAAAARGAISKDSAEELEEAFTTLCRVRLEHQAAQVERGVPPDNHVDPQELAPAERRQLKDAFRAIARAQGALETRPATRIP
jgi:CBS domain-containing protein